MPAPALAEVGAGLGGIALFTAAGAGLLEVARRLGLCRLALGPRLAYAYLLGIAGIIFAIVGLLMALSALDQVMS